MYQEKTIIRCRKDENSWLIKKGKTKLTKRGPGIYHLFTLICTLLLDKGKIYYIDVIVKRRR